MLGGGGMVFHHFTLRPQTSKDRRELWEGRVGGSPGGMQLRLAGAVSLVSATAKVLGEAQGGHGGGRPGADSPAGA